MSGGIPSAAFLEQEPGPPFGFVNPNFNKAGSSNVLMFFADTMGLTQARGECLAVLAQLSKHVPRLDVRGIIIRYALQAGDMADGPKRGSPYLADALSDRVRHGEELIA